VTATILPFPGCVAPVSVFRPEGADVWLIPDRRFVELVASAIADQLNSGRPIYLDSEVAFRLARIAAESIQPAKHSAKRASSRAKCSSYPVALIE
jgi:hypothetical protein